MTLYLVKRVQLGNCLFVEVMCCSLGCDRYAERGGALYAACGYAERGGDVGMQRGEEMWVCREGRRCGYAERGGALLQHVGMQRGEELVCSMWLYP